MRYFAWNRRIVEALREAPLPRLHLGAVPHAALEPPEERILSGGGASGVRLGAEPQQRQLGDAHAELDGRAHEVHGGCQRDDSLRQRDAHQVRLL